MRGHGFLQGNPTTTTTYDLPKTLDQHVGIRYVMVVFRF